MRYPTTVFDRPQWNLLPDPKGRRTYGIVDNLTEVVNGRASYRVCLSVPTELFTFLREVAKVTPDSSVTLSLDLVDSFWIFSAMVEGASGDSLYDLWAYTSKQLPEWMPDRQYRA